MSSFKVNFALAFSLLCWASAFVGIRIGLVDYSPGALALLRFLVASLCMALIYIFLPKQKKIPWSDRLQLLFLGSAAIGIYNSCLNYGELSVSAGVASFVIGLMPVFTIGLSVILFRERPNWLVCSGLGISLLGLWLLLIGESQGTIINSGVLMILIATLMGSIYNVSQRHFLKKYHPVVVTSWVMWGGTLFLLIFAPQLAREWGGFGLQASRAAIYMGILPGALAYVAWTYVLSCWSASRAAVYLYALPVLSTLMGYFILQEHPSKLSLIGGLVALLGALIANRFKNVILPSDEEQDDILLETN